MTILEFLPKRIDSIKKNFAENYGNRDLAILQRELNTSTYVESIFNLLRGFSAPSADSVFEILRELKVVSQLCPILNQTNDEYEKKIDYGFVTCVLILEKWRNGFIPEIEQKGLNTNVHNEVSVAGMVDFVINQIGEKFDELEKQSKN